MLRNDVRFKMKDLCEEKGLTLLAASRVSDHPDDSHLANVLVVKEDEQEFIVYVYNFEDNAFYSGKYFNKPSQAGQCFMSL